MLRVLGGIALSVLLQATTAWAIPIHPDDTVTANSIEWAQVSLFTNTAWSSINAVCPAGICDGELTANGVNYDMRGWRWASIVDMNALINSYLVPGGIPSLFWFPSTGGSAVGSGNIAAAELFYADHWIPTRNNFDRLLTTTGYMSDSFLDPVDGSLHPGIALVELYRGSPPCVGWCNFNAPFLMISTRGTDSTPQDAKADVGAWFFRSASPTTVDTPSTLLIMGLGLAGLGFNYRHQARIARNTPRHSSSLINRGEG